MKMKIRKNILKIVATGIATGLAFPFHAGAWLLQIQQMKQKQRKRRNMMLCKRYFWKLIKKQQKISFLN